MSSHTAYAILSTNVRMLMWAPFRSAMRIFSTLLPDQMESWAMQRFLTPTRHGHRQAEIALLEQGEYFEVKIGGYRVAAWSFGDKSDPVVVCSHGWSGRGAQFRSFIEPLLASGFRVVVFDHPGHGFSSGKTSSLIEFSAALARVCLTLHDQGARIHGVIAHSLGGAATALALKRLHLKADRIVLIAPPSSLIAYSRRFARFLGLSERIRLAVQRRIEVRFGVPWSALELPESVNGITASALIIHDEDDKEVRIADGRALARSWRDARFVSTRGLGHRAILRDPNVVQDSVDFLTASVEFPRLRHQDEWSQFPGPAPLF